MTVAELIAQLQQFPPDTRVLALVKLDEMCGVKLQSVEMWPMEKLSEESSLTFERWEDASVKDFQAGKFEPCVVLLW